MKNLDSICHPDKQLIVGLHTKKLYRWISQYLNRCSKQFHCTKYRSHCLLPLDVDSGPVECSWCLNVKIILYTLHTESWRVFTLWDGNWSNFTLLFVSFFKILYYVVFHYLLLVYPRKSEQPQIYLRPTLSKKRDPSNQQLQTACDGYLKYVHK